jgi:hypothetical protein
MVYIRNYLSCLTLGNANKVPAKTFLPKRFYQNVPTETFLKIKFLQKRVLAIKYIGTHGSQVHMVPRYTWFPGIHGSQVHMVPRYTWFPGTHSSQVQMVPRYKCFLCFNGFTTYRFVKCFTQKSRGINNFKKNQKQLKYKNIVKELQIKNCNSIQELQVKNCKSRIASQELQVKN